MIGAIVFGLLLGLVLCGLIPTILVWSFRAGMYMMEDWPQWAAALVYFGPSLSLGLVYFWRKEPKR